MDGLRLGRSRNDDGENKSCSHVRRPDGFVSSDNVQRPRHGVKPVATYSAMAFRSSLILPAPLSRRLNDFAPRSAFVNRATRTFMPAEPAEDALEAGTVIAA